MLVQIRYYFSSYNFWHPSNFYIIPPGAVLKVSSFQAEYCGLWWLLTVAAQFVQCSLPSDQFCHVNG